MLVPESDKEASATPRLGTEKAFIMGTSYQNKPTRDTSRPQQQQGAPAKSSDTGKSGGVTAKEAKIKHDADKKKM
jgi:hypothetical protein